MIILKMFSSRSELMVVYSWLVSHNAIVWVETCQEEIAMSHCLLIVMEIVFYDWQVGIVCVTFVQNVTLQAVLATDSKRTLLVLNYDRQRMLWNPESEERKFFLGMSDGAGQVVKLPVTDVYRPDQDSNIGKLCTSGNYSA